MTTDNHSERMAARPLSFKNGEIAITESSIRDFEIARSSPIDGVLVILCSRGEVSVDIGGHTCMARPGDLLICMPEIMVENGKTSADFQFKSIFMSVDYAFHMLPLSARNWNFKMFFEQNPRIHLTDDEVWTFNRYFDLLRAKFVDRTNPYRDNVINSLVEAMVYDFRNAFGHLLLQHPPRLSSGEHLFDRFVEMLSTAYPKPRSVACYAGWLHITPKYLSVVCKKVGGRSASKIIDTYVSKDIERLLKNSRKSVKEISVELDFPNTSFFGHYVKKHFGCTPNELRLRLNGVGD